MKDFYLEIEDNFIYLMSFKYLFNDVDEVWYKRNAYVKC